ncbi:hypothetical protein JXB02_01285 [Candidatus Woesearchaeota archaeon]|nr:hypothetical protein [Candidatus Woesearchaeota archaeon]
MLEDLLRKVRTGIGVTLLSSALLIGCKDSATDPAPEVVREREPIPVTFFDDTAVRWIAYSPTNYDPQTGTIPSEQSVTEDLEVLKSHYYNGIFTYGADNILGQVPRIAKNLGLSHVVLGLWSLDSPEEWANAVAAKHFVDGYCVGNEGLLSGRYTSKEVIARMQELRDATGKPVTTTEPVGLYDDELLKAGDWVFPNAHPYWNGMTHPENAAAWTAAEHSAMRGRTDRIVVLKETGLPTGGDGSVSQQGQNDYYRALEGLLAPDSVVAFAYFEAFDQEWKRHAAVEPYWGLFGKDRNEKLVSTPQVRYTFVPARGSSYNLEGRVVNVIPADCRVSTYIYVGGQWWMKPYWDRPLTAINDLGKWVTDITTGGIDASATKINSYLVAPDYQPVAHTLPDLSDPKVFAMTSVER